MYGCPHQCVFCNQHSITGKNQHFSLDSIAGQLKEALEIYMIDRPYKEIAFFGGSFTCLPISTQKAILELAQKYIQNNTVNGIRVSTRPDAITEEILDLLQTYHVTTIELGVQSTNNQVLFACARGHTADDIFNSVELIHNYPFKLGLQIMIGLPQDTFEILISTVMDIVNMHPDFVRIYPAIVLPGSDLETLYLCGKYHPLTLESAVAIVRDIKIVFERFNIPVIRTGLQSNEGLDTGVDRLAGPYHPAFGELVDSAIYLEWIEELVNMLPINSSTKTTEIPWQIQIITTPACLSKVIGHKKCNLLILKKKFPWIHLKIMADSYVPSNQLIVDCQGVKFALDKSDFIKAKAEGILESTANY